MTVLGLIVAAFTMSLIMRSTFVALAPVSDVLGADLGLDPAGMGLLMAIPVLCFGLFSPIASIIIARAGANFAMTAMFLGVALGIIVRSAGGTAAAFVGTIILGAAITVGNVVLPVLVRRDAPPKRAGIATGVFIAGANVGSLVSTVTTVPLVGAIGWQLALGSWVLVVAASLAVWVVIIRPRHAFRLAPEAGLTPAAVLETPPIEAVPAPMLRERTWGSLTAVALLVGFGAQTFSYYGLTAWLPSLLADRLGIDAAEAGGAAGIFQICAIVGSLAAPLVAARLGSFVAVMGIALCWVAVPLGLLFAPEGWALWITLGGIAQGGGITIVLTLVTEVARSHSHVRRLSAFVQGGGYALGATGSIVLGAAFGATGAWTLPLVIVLGSTLTYGVLVGAAALRAGRASRRTPPQ